MSDREEEQEYSNFESMQTLLKVENNEEASKNSNENQENYSDNEIAEEEKSEAAQENSESEKHKKFVKPMPVNKSRKKKIEKFIESDEYSDEEEEEMESEDGDYNDSESEEDYEYTRKKRPRGGDKDKKAKKSKKSKKGKRKKKIRGGGLIDFEAESDEENEVSDNEGELTNEQQQRLMNEQLKRRDERRQFAKKQSFYNVKSEQELIERYEKMDEESLQDPEEYKDDLIVQQGRQASITDPKLWLIKCKLGKERDCVNNLYHKFFSLANTKSPLKILSALCFENLKGYIYIEAFKEANVREAVQDISFLRENSIKIVPITEMTQVFNYDKIERVDIKPGKWVRIKTGIYEGDLAQVVDVEDPVSKIYLKLIPRLSDSVLQQNDSLKAANPFGGKKPLFKPKQKLFNPDNYQNADLKKTTHPVLRDQVYVYNKMAFHDGFLIKSMRAKSLILDDVDPKLDELRIFNYSKYKKGEDDNENGLADLISTIQETELTKKKYFKQGDKVRIITGSLKNIPGKVVSHNNKLVSLIPEIEGYNEVIELPEEYLVKLFLPGDLVKVYRGPNSGKYGLVTRVEDEIAFVYSDTLNAEFKVSCRDLILSSQMVDETDNNSYFQLGDLVKINGTNMICYVLDVFKHYLKVIDTRNEIKNCNLKDLTKITQNKPNGIDCKRNPITRNDNVKVISGLNKDKKGVIKTIYRNFIFLHNTEFINSNGVFVEKSENVEIMGSELLASEDMNYNAGAKVNFKKIPDQYKKLIGKQIKIIAGNWKGYQGILKTVMDKRARIELHSKNKTISVDVNCIQDLYADANINNNNSLNDSINTPRHYPTAKTPTYFPQSPSYNQSWNPSTPHYWNNTSPNPNYNSFMSPGNAYK